MRRTFAAVTERDSGTALYVGFVPGRNLKEVVEMLLEDGEPNVEAEFIGTQPA